MASKALLVGVGYRKRSGKDTIADYLVENYGFKKTSWADLLKKGINVWHGWDDRHAYGELKEVVDPYWGYTPRHAYQWIGTNCIRDHHMRDFWVKAAMRQINEWLEAGYSVVVPDTRFWNEGDAILQNDGFVWRVDRPSLPAPRPAPKNRLVRWIAEKLLKRSYDHDSEVGLVDFSKWSEVIVNDGTLRGLYDKVDELMMDFRLGQLEAKEQVTSLGS